MARDPGPDNDYRAEDDAPEGARISDRGGEQELADRMRAAMLEKLEANRGKLHWTDGRISIAYLVGRLYEEVEELVGSLDGDGDPWKEAADVGNFAAMIADRVTPRPTDG